jgi:hypothetical protein
MRTVPVGWMLSCYNFTLCNEVPDLREIATQGLLLVSLLEIGSWSADAPTPKKVTEDNRCAFIIKKVP